MRFVIYGRFEASGIDDAFARLAAHFDGLTEGIRPSQDDGHDGPWIMTVRPAEPGATVHMYEDDR
jgi:hypothetical protein